MKKFGFVIVALLIAAILIGVTYFLYEESTEEPVVYQTIKPQVLDIVRKTVATGKIVPRKEVDIKPQISGVISEVFAVAGTRVNKGDQLAKIEIIPDMEQLNNAESQLEQARISYQNAARELARQRQLVKENLVSETDFNRFLLERDLQREAVKSAENNVALIKDGASKNADKVSNIVWATVSGTVLDVPVKQGTFVTETNNFNDGTTIATIADMSDMIFEGSVDESEVGKIAEGMQLLLKIGALEGETFTATLEYISPKGVEDRGTIRFNLRAAMQPRQGIQLRAGYSANADIILDERKAVLAINEAVLRFEAGQPYVELETAPQVFERRDIDTGLSDGINIEVVSGLSEGDAVKRP